MVIIMSDKLYLDNLKTTLNDDKSTIIYEEYQIGPLEETILVPINLNVAKFKKYYQKITSQRKG